MIIPFFNNLDTNSKSNTTQELRKTDHIVKTTAIDPDLVLGYDTVKQALEDNSSNSSSNGNKKSSKTSNGKKGSSNNNSSDTSTLQQQINPQNPLSSFMKQFESLLSPLGDFRELPNRLNSV